MKQTLSLVLTFDLCIRKTNSKLRTLSVRLSVLIFQMPQQYTSPRVCDEELGANRSNMSKVPQIGVGERKEIKVILVRSC